MKHLIAGLFLVASSVAMADVTGNYKCSGHDPFTDKDYTYDSLVISKSGDAFELKYHKKDNSNPEKGVGVLNSDSTVLSVMFEESKGKNKLGVQSYSISSDGNTLSGPWAVIDKTKSGSETCTRVEEESKAAGPVQESTVSGSSTESESPVTNATVDSTVPGAGSSTVTTTSETTTKTE